VAEKFQTWNTALRNAAQQFGKDHPEATILLFSSFEAFDAILNKPEEHGLDPEDVKRFGGSIWMDHIHPTSKVHDRIAYRVASFLESVVSKEDAVNV
jgi:phospholipase/lecithinase/hemolysin